MAERKSYGKLRMAVGAAAAAVFGLTYFGIATGDRAAQGDGQAAPMSIPIANEVALPQAPAQPSPSSVTRQPQSPGGAMTQQPQPRVKRVVVVPKPRARTRAS